MLNAPAILQEISRDRALGMSMVFEHRHPQESPPMHVEIVDLWRSAHEFVVIDAFRESAKSTLSEEFLTLEAAFQNFHYCLIIGETYDKACQRLDAIKHELLSNTRLKGLFGKLKGSTWNENLIELHNGVIVQAAGWDQEHRGYKVRDRRPDRAYLDDWENKERVRDTKTVDENWSRFWKELVPAMDKEYRKIRATGTPLADDCMINRMLADPQFVKGVFPICKGEVDDPHAEAMWPQRYPMEWIREERKNYAAKGLLRDFDQEYMLVAAQTAGKPFKEEQFRFMDIAPLLWMPKVVILDPARTVDIRTSDQTGRVVVSRMGTKILVHESGAEYWKPDEVVEAGFRLSERHGDAPVVIEKNSLDDWLLQPFRNEMLRRGRTIEIKPVQAPQDRDKDQFIMGLQPFFEAGDIVFVGGRSAHQTLISQCLNFPSGKKDCINALAYSLRVFSGTPVYEDFGGQNVETDVQIARDAVLVLAAQETSGTAAYVLLEVEGQSVSVLADWVSTQSAMESCRDVSTLVRAVYPGHRLSCIVPAELHDQSDRLPLVRALRSVGLSPTRGAHVQMARGCLTPLIRMEMRGRRMLRVDSRATYTAQALAGGYCYPAGSKGQQGGEPEKGIYRIVAEALECAVSALEQIQDAGLPSGANIGTNVHGAQYITALPGRR